MNINNREIITIFTAHDGIPIKNVNSNPTINNKYGEDFKKFCKIGRIEIVGFKYTTKDITCHNPNSFASKIRCKIEFW
jgi:hypothetical protein